MVMVMKREVSVGDGHDHDDAGDSKRQRRLDLDDVVATSMGPGFADLSDELILHCLSYLSLQDLVQQAQVNRRMHRLANDNQLWKRLYLRNNAGNARGLCSLDASSPLFRLSQRDRSWNELYRIAHNWTTGNARTTRLSIRSTVLPPCPDDVGIADDVDVDDTDADAGAPASNEPAGSTAPQQPCHVAWYGQYYLLGQRIARQDRVAPEISVVRCASVVNPHHSLAKDDSHPLHVIRSPALLSLDDLESQGISDMRLDDHPYSETSGVRLAVFYSSGQYSIFRLRNLHYGATESFQYEEEYFSSHLPSRPTVMARLHSPLLVTVAQDHSIRFRLLEERKTSIGPSSEVLQELHVSMSQPVMRSHLVFAPMVMRLEAISTALPSARPSSVTERSKARCNHFRVSLAYSTPFYPAAFTVGTQVFDVFIPNADVGHPNVDGAATPSRSRNPRLDIITRSAVAVPPTSSMPVTPAMNTPAAAGQLATHDQAVVTSIEQDGNYIVTSKTDNTISVYEVDDPLRKYGFSRLSTSEQQGGTPSSPYRMTSLPVVKLRHVRTLFGHTASVDAVSVADGRCVSTGRDGVKVWELPQRSAEDEVESEALTLTDEQHWNPTVDVREQHSDAGQNPVKHPNGFQTRDGMSHAVTGATRCNWLGLDASKIVAVCADPESGREMVKVYDFE